LRKSVRNLEFDPHALEDLAWWIKNDRKKALKIIKLVEFIQRDPFKGIGDPEPLKYELAGAWSRHIDQEHRIVYQVFDDKIRILSCRYHY
jgi:toxin YoeB